MRSSNPLRLSSPGTPAPPPSTCASTTGTAASSAAHSVTLASGQSDHSAAPAPVAAAKDVVMEA